MQVQPKILGDIELYTRHDVREVAVISDIGVQIISQIKKNDFEWHTVQVTQVPREHLEKIFNKIVDEDLWDNEVMN